MATPKIITAQDLKMGTIKMHLQNNDILSIVQGYSFTDGIDVLDILSQRTVTESKLFSNLPANIRQALTDINNYMYNLALTQEGMK